MKTRSLTEGAMLGAITVLLAILGEYIGVPSIIVPIPLMLLVYRQGFQYGILAPSRGFDLQLCGRACVLWPVHYYLGLCRCRPGLGLREKFSFGRLMVVGVLSNLVVFGLNFLLYSLIIVGNMLTDLLTMMNEALQQAADMSQSLGVTGDALQQYEALQAFLPVVLRTGLPSLLLVYSVSMSYINLVIGRAVLKRLGDSTMPEVTPFSRWRIPGFFGLIFAFGLIVTTMAQMAELPGWVEFLGLNAFLISFYSYLVAGVSLAWYYFQKKNIPTFLRVLFVLMLFSMPLVLMILIVLTVADGVFDFRKLNASEDKN